MKIFMLISASAIVDQCEALCAAFDFQALSSIDVSKTIACASPLFTGHDNDSIVIIECMSNLSISTACVDSILSHYNASVTSCEACLSARDYGDACKSCIASSALQAVSLNTPLGSAGDCETGDLNAFKSLNVSEVYDCTSDGNTLTSCLAVQANLSDQCTSSLMIGISDRGSECEWLCSYVEDPSSIETCNYCLWLSYTATTAILTSSTLFSAQYGFASAVYNFLTIVFGL